MYTVFKKKDSKTIPVAPVPEETPNFNFTKLKEEIKEIEQRKEFQVALERFEGKQKTKELKEKMVKQGLSKSVPRKGDQMDAPDNRRKVKEVPKIGDIKKDKLKNSLAMTEKEKETLVAREKEMSRNRGVCMSEIQVPGPGAYKPKYTQQDRKLDRVTALKDTEIRITYFDKFFGKQKKIN